MVACCHCPVNVARMAFVRLGKQQADWIAHADAAMCQASGRYAIGL